MHAYNLFNVDFGSSKANATGSSGVGYTILDITGSIVEPRTTVGVTQVAPGIYSAAPHFPHSDPSYQILWDTGTAFPKTYYASETVNNLKQFFELTASISAVNDAVSMAATVLSGARDDLTQLKIDVALIRDFTAGRWKMSNNQMIFYKEDNLTEIARFNLFDDGGNPSMESVFERKKIVS